MQRNKIEHIDILVPALDPPKNQAREPRTTNLALCIVHYKKNSWHEHVEIEAHRRTDRRVDVPGRM